MMLHSEVLGGKTLTNLFRRPNSAHKQSARKRVELTMTKVFGQSNWKYAVASRQNGEGCRWSSFGGKISVPKVVQCDPQS